MIKTTAIILHRYSYSDTSWIVKSLTESNGIISFIVKGGKKKDSPFKNSLEPLSYSELVFNYNPNSDLQFIKEASIINWHKTLRENLLALSQAQVMAEILLRYAPQGVPLDEEFFQLKNTLQFMDSKDSKDNFSRWLLETCNMWGYQLDLEHCTCCKNPFKAPAADFSPESGSFLCENCLGELKPRAKQETLLGFWKLSHSNEAYVEDFQYTENALIAYLRYHIGFFKEIHSLRFLQEVRKCYRQ